MSTRRAPLAVVLVGVVLATTLGGAGTPSVTATPPGPSHSDAADDVQLAEGTPASYAPHVDIERLDYAASNATARFTLTLARVGDVPGMALGAQVVAQVRTGRGVSSREISLFDGETVWVTGHTPPRQGISTTLSIDAGCDGATHERDEARRTITYRVPMRCLAKGHGPTELRAQASTYLLSTTLKTRTHGAWDEMPRGPWVEVA